MKVKHTLSILIFLALVITGTLSQAPDTYQIKFHTDVQSGGDIIVNITREWAPIGADHLYKLVKDQFYDGAAFFRVVPDFVIQFGIAGEPAENVKWKAPIKDDPVLKSNVKYTMTYATAGPNTRTTQLFINLNDNAFLDNQGFAPLGMTVEGTELLPLIFNPTPGSQGGVDQQQYEEKGNDWIKKQYPGINFSVNATIIET